MAVARGQVRYSIPEEMTKGSLVGNIVQDLGLDVKRLKSGRARIFTEDSHVGGTGTLQHVYNYEVCRTTDSRKSDLKYGRPCSESIISLDTSGTQTLTHAQKAKLNHEDSFDQPLVLCVFVMAVARGQVRYSIPEEMTKGSLVGNIVQDLGLDVKRLKSGRARIFTEDSREYIGLNVDKGTLRPKRRIFDADFIMANETSRAVLLCHGRCARAGPLFYSRGDDKGLAGGKYCARSRFGC
ncbi:protocadherin beta-16-like protein [Labeo rohita]|uniref:Protocadherin beta-16-like protein n=1 Tax=Labeo rohita TaxID=84645 RepID=A0A498LTR7_LABRO|nr:protocadherin beta-16-like protein [Labeo rohita]